MREPRRISRHAAVIPRADAMRDVETIISMWNIAATCRACRSVAVGLHESPVSTYSSHGATMSHVSTTPHTLFNTLVSAFS